MTIRIRDFLEVIEVGDMYGTGIIFLIFYVLLGSLPPLWKAERIVIDDTNWDEIR